MASPWLRHSSEEGRPKPVQPTRRGVCLFAGAAAAITIGSGFALARSADDARPKTIYVIRHGEKPDANDDHDLSKEGWARAAMLARVASEIFPGLAFVFASKPVTKYPSRREIETVKPLCRTAGLALNCDFPEGAEKSLALSILGHPAAYGGSVILIAWHHSRIPVLIEKLGYARRIEKPQDTEFDGIWQLNYATGSKTPPQFDRPGPQPAITEADLVNGARFRKEFAGAPC
jgi:hypothetical protein